MDIRQLVSQFFMEQAAPPAAAAATTQGFSINVALSGLKGASELEWTRCYERTCKTIPDEFDMKICKAQCQWRSMNVLITRMNGLRSNCRQTGNPTGCLKVVDNAVKAERNAQGKIREHIRQIRTQKEEFNRKQALRR
jgi:hypothetical protein